jgi:hypothetical protein
MHLLDLSSSSLLIPLGGSRLVHANEDAIVALLASTLPVPTAIISSRATADVAEVHTASLASHVVAAAIMLDSALATRACLLVHASGQANHVCLRSFNTLGTVDLVALGHVWMMFSGVSTSCSAQFMRQVAGHAPQPPNTCLWFAMCVERGPMNMAVGHGQ